MIKVQIQGTDGNECTTTALVLHPRVTTGIKRKEANGKSHD